MNKFTQQISNLCKPPGSLGELEWLAAQLCDIQQTDRPETRPRHVTIFAADHGIVDEGVSAWPRGVTFSVVQLMLKQKTASGVFARELGATYEVVDVGMQRSLTQLQAIENVTANPSSVRCGTNNFRIGPAMTADEFDKAWAVGASRASHASEQNAILIGGEMGIGNTTSASCMACLLADLDPLEATGRGAGIDDAGLARKRTVIAEVVARVRHAKIDSPKSIACEVGGFEIVALAGYYAAAAKCRRVVLLDGFIATAAGLLAECICPGTVRFMIAGHRSSEQAHGKLLQHMGLRPLLDLGCRLGEASGALIALPLLDLAASMLCGMATLQELEPS